MKKFTILFILVSTFCFSQEKITKNLGDFHELKIYRGLEVELIKAETQKIVIEGKKSEQVTVKNSNGILRVSLKALETFSADDVKVFIYFSEDIDIIDVNEGSIITSERIIKQDKLVLKVQEAGKIKLEIGTTDVEIKSISGGKITLEGYSENQKVNANTGGNYEGEGLKTDHTDVSVASGSNAIINASKLVDAKATLGGTITITGEPAEINKKETLGGYVRH